MLEHTGGARGSDVATGLERWQASETTDVVDKG